MTSPGVERSDRARRVLPPSYTGSGRRSETPIAPRPRRESLFSHDPPLVQIAHLIGQRIAIGSEGFNVRGGNSLRLLHRPNPHDSHRPGEERSSPEPDPISILA